MVTAALAPPDEAPIVAPVAAEDLPAGTTEVIVGPFARFSALAAFMQALKAQPGVTGVVTRQVHRGTVYLRVRYDGVIPLRTSLEQLVGYDLEVVAEQPHRLEVRVRSTGDEGASAAEAARRRA